MKFIRLFLALMTLAAVPTALGAQGAAASSQKMTVSGTVSEASGATLPGAVVSVIDPATGTPKSGFMADIDGGFSVQCTPGTVLEFSFLGFKSERVTVKDKSVIKVVLQPDVSFTLDEAVAIGYGSVRREDLTGSVSSVKMGDEKPCYLVKVCSCTPESFCGVRRSIIISIISKSSKPSSFCRKSAFQFCAVVSILPIPFYER